MTSLFYCQECRTEEPLDFASTTSSGACKNCGGSEWREIDLTKKVIAVAGDTEFTCFDKIAGDVLDTGLVEILEDFTLGREFQVNSAPTSAKYFTEAAQKVHGISYFKAMTFPTRRESCIEIMKWLKFRIDQFPLKFVYHGQGRLDHAWLQEHFRKEDFHNSWYKVFPDHMVESTLKMARDNLKQIESHKLKKLAEFYEIPLDNHHSALPDARACAIVYCKLMKGEKVWTGQLI
jgi:DNA polymerase III epsilon subunit-like protein